MCAGLILDEAAKTLRGLYGNKLDALSIERLVVVFFVGVKLTNGGGGYRLFGECVRKINLLNVQRLRQLGLVMAF